MLRSLFQWLDTHPDSYWIIVAVPTLLWASCVFATVRDDKPRGYFRSEAAFLLLLLATLVAWRWPFWLNAEAYNADESQLIAGAITLTRDPLFWRAVDGTTSGPLNFYALLPLHWLGAPLDYFCARVTGIILVWAALVGCYWLTRSWFGRAAARLASLPLTLYFAAAIDPDFVHYSSEHPALALIAFAACALLNSSPPPQRAFFFVLGGFIAGSLPWAKLQTTPIAATLVGLGIWRIYTLSPRPAHTRFKLASQLVLAALLPSVLVAAIAGASGNLENVYRDYFVQNFSYVNQDWAATAAIRDLWRFTFGSGNLPAFAGVSFLAIGMAAVSAKFFTKQIFIAAGILTCVAVFCVLAPKRASLHYTLLLVIPLGIWSGISIGGLWQLQTRSPQWRLWTTAVAFGAMLTIIAVRSGQGVPQMFGQFSDHWRRPRSATGAIVRALSNPKDRLAVWGWTDRVYVEADLAQATHESESFEQIGPSFQREHYRARYLSDLKKTRPAIFVDATGPGAYYFTDRAKAGHETVPALAAYVQENYRLLADLGNARIFVTPERLAERPLSETRLWEMIANARRDFEARKPVSLVPRQLAQKKIHNRPVQMMLPPAEMVWALEGSEREVFAEYGFDPKAYISGTGNGAEIIFELSSPGSPALPLFRRMLDPYKRPDDRGNLVSKIVLPPYKPGSKLVVRTSPGEFGDTAWDWIYVGKLDWVRAPFFSPNQFPSFARVPQEVAGEYISIIETPEGKLLMIHPPAFMKFSLTGKETHWHFEYGFQPGAYSGDERTDGAIFTLTLEHDGKTSVLFSRNLDPAGVPADQGRQQADVTLSKIAKGDQVVMRIDPGKSAAWDWTYLTNLQVESASSDK